MRTLERFRQEFGCFLFKPNVRAELAEQFGNLLDRLVVADRLAAVFAIEDRDRQSPVTLSGDTPVRSLSDHGNDPVFAPCGDPFDVVAGFDSFFFEGIDRAEPLRRCSEDDGILASPAMGIFMFHLFGCEQRSAFRQVMKDSGVGLLVEHAGIRTGFFRLITSVVHGDREIQIISAAGHKVIRTETGSGMNASST